MGQDTSRPSSRGFRVLAVQKGSPGAKAGLVSFFDIILGTTEHRFQNDDDLFQKLLSKHKNSKITLSVYNIKACTVREVVLIPMEWKGKGLLGVTIRFDSWEEDEGHYLHVLNVLNMNLDVILDLILLVFLVEFVYLLIFYILHHYHHIKILLLATKI